MKAKLASFLTAATVVTLAGPTIKLSSKLTWDLNYWAEGVQGYNLYVYDGTNGTAFRTNTYAAPPIHASEFMTNRANGNYKVTLTAFNPAGESEHSDPLEFFWVGNKPSKVVNLVFE